jgi:signal transduction histidine kinase
MKTPAANYLRLFAEWVTDSRERYRSDILFRSTTSVVALLLGLGILSLALFSVVLTSANEAVVHAIVSDIQAIVHNPGSTPALTDSIGSIQAASFWYVVVGVLLLGGLFGFLLFRFMLLPARNTLHYQKIFISNVAHELRTPLSIIKTSTEVALLDEKASPATRRTFGEIVHELDRISEIINNLLSLGTLTRPERMRFSNVDLNPLVDRVAERHLPLAEERGIALTVKKDNYAVVWGNATALEQVVANLVKNAVMYTRRDSKGSVVVSLHPDYQGSVSLSVTDNGVGINERDLAHIFEPFYRADASRARSTNATGSGLGLTIVNEIVRAHHGKIYIESARSQGTTVSVSLPVGISAEMAPEIGRNKSHVSLDFSSGLASILPKSLRKAADPKNS